jgi:threonine aldolase
MVYFAVDPARMNAPELAARLLAAHGVRVGPIDEKTLRAVTHLDVAGAGIEAAIRAVREVLAK